MKLKTLSLYKDFVNFLHREGHKAPKYAKIGDLTLTFKLINTAELSSESKLTYAYLFFHRNDISGIRVPGLSRILGMTAEQIRNTLNELTTKRLIKLITTRQSADFSELSYYYAIVNPDKYGMSDLDEEPFTPDDE
jgi:hypothetical protein